MADNQITPFQLTDQFTMDNFNQRINETNTALQNKVPVLNRETAISSDDDLLSRIETAEATIRANNYYGGAAILPIHFAVVHPVLGSSNNTLFIRCLSDTVTDVTATINAYGVPITVQRLKVESGWGPWEWVNPPMKLGEEYRTTERYRGKPVYTMAINTKTIGLGVVDDYPHGIANVDDIWVCGGSFIESGANKYSIPFFGGASDSHVIACANRHAVHRINSSNVYVITDMTVILKYTKLTDN